MLDQDGVGLADQHGTERGNHEQAEGEALHHRAHLARDYLEVVPNRHILPILPQSGRGVWPVRTYQLIHRRQNAAQSADVFQARPVPSATQDSGSSAIETGRPVSSRST